MGGGAEGVSQRQKIEVAVEISQGRAQDENRRQVVSFKAEITFGHLEGRSRKTLIMTRTGGRWAIHREKGS